VPSSIASLTLTFGLVAIPVQLVSATSSHKIGFRQIHTEDHGRVRNVKVCETDGTKLEQEDIGRAYEAPDGTLVPISDDELDQMPLPTARTVEISGFLDLAALPGEMYDRPYFLTPQSPAANKPYVLMREALARAGKGAVGKYALRGSENLGVIHAQGDVLVLQRLRWPDEIRRADTRVPDDVGLSEDEVGAAMEYISASGDLDMNQMHDEYAAAVKALIDAKTEHREPPKKPEPEAPEGDVVDLMSALQASADRAREQRGDRDADVHHLAGRKQPAKKAAEKTAKKAPARKTTSRSKGKRAG
jgi:DNA end-binding protein Ku